MGFRVRLRLLERKLALTTAKQAHANRIPFIVYLDQHKIIESRLVANSAANFFESKRLFNYSVDRMGVAKIHEEHCLS